MPVAWCVVTAWLLSSSHQFPFVASIPDSDSLYALISQFTGSMQYATERVCPQQGEVDPRGSGGTVNFMTV